MKRRRTDMGRMQDDLFGTAPALASTAQGYARKSSRGETWRDAACRLSSGTRGGRGGGGEGRGRKPVKRPATL
eukprot:6041816-Pyramimonas_sp.AAC.3